MYQLLKHLGWKKTMAGEMLPFAIAMVIADLFYKFGSFILECGAFLATWFVCSWVVEKLVVIRRKFFHHH